MEAAAARAAWQHAYQMLAEAKVAPMWSKVSMAQQIRRHVGQFTAVTGISV
jgi:hypothetical protein